MRKLISLATVLMALVLGACGDNTITPGTGGVTGPDGEAPVSGVTVLASAPTLQSDSSQSLDISVIVRDTNNVATEGVTVILSADSGTLRVTNPVTDQNGLVTATLTGGGDPTPRAITVTADAQGVTGGVTVDVVGTDLLVNGPPALAQNDVATYTIVLTDGAGNGIANQVVEITSANGNTLSDTSVTTDSQGQAQVQVTATSSGADTITATALGIMAEGALNVSDDTFVLTAPAAASEIVLNTPQPITLNWSVGGVPQAGQTITFSATRGTLTQLTAVTNAAGEATVDIQSTNAGPSIITATNAGGTSTQVQVQFIADAPASIDVQANPFTIGPNEQSAITAIVRDADNNLVTNAIVQFDLQDVTGGELSVASATTNFQGRATTFYTSSQTTSANNGVIVTATVQGTAISGDVALTVSQRELFISMGTGNSIFEPNSAAYRVEFQVTVTDSQGNGVEGVTVQAGILSNAYYKGFWFYDTVQSAWVQNVTAGPCIDEDINNRNGVLDPGEDLNGSGRIEAGNIATVASQVSGNGTFTTDASGIGVLDVVYPQDHARWVAVTLEATTSVAGTEFARASNFILTISGDDVDDENETPPGQISPFGSSATCLDTN